MHMYARSLMSSLAEHRHTRTKIFSELDRSYACTVCMCVCVGGGEGEGEGREGGEMEMESVGEKREFCSKNQRHR